MSDYISGRFLKNLHENTEEKILFINNLVKDENKDVREFFIWLFNHLDNNADILADVDCVADISRFRNLCAGIRCTIVDDDCVTFATLRWPKHFRNGGDVAWVVVAHGDALTREQFMDNHWFHTPMDVELHSDWRKFMGDVDAWLGSKENTNG